MKIELHARGCGVEGCTPEEENEIVKLIEKVTLDLEFLPRKGDNMWFSVGDWSINAVVDYSVINYCEPGNPYFIERIHGTTFSVFLKDIEVVEYFKD